jgi:protein-S-isoprenylcysteine O-methyltransferase Ste14
MAAFVVFAAASAGLIWYTWRAYRETRTHAVFRFFAFESILLLCILNLKRWFRDPFSVLQIVSWLLLIVSLVLVVQGFYLLHHVGRPDGTFEDTTVLVRRGAYKYIRHPLYSSLLFLAWGVFFKGLSLPAGALALVTSASLFATARVEEADNLHKFGDDYAEYMRTTRMFVPFLF